VKGNKTTSAKRRKVTFFRVTLVLLLVAGCAFAIYRLHLRSELNARIETIRAAGYPVTCAELDKWYSLPEGAENAAYTITDAFSYYVEPQDVTLVPIAGQVELPPSPEPLTEETRAAVAEYIADNKKALELLHAGAAIENCRYARDLTAGHETRMDDLSCLKRSVRLLCVEAVGRADIDPNASVCSIISGLGIARSLKREPIVISQLVRIASHSLTLSTLEHLLNRITLTEGQLRQLNAAVIKAQCPSALSCAIVGDRCVGLAMLRMPPAELARTYLLSGPSWRVTENVHLKSVVLTVYKFSGLVDRSIVTYLDLMDDLVNLVQLPRNGPDGVSEAVKAMCDEVSNSNFLLRDLLGGISRLDTMNLIDTAHLRVTQTALAVERYRIATGRLPKAISSLVPVYLEAVPKDPFDGNELRYKRFDSGFVVYSIGEDLSDDGGKDRQAQEGGRWEPPNWDVTFIVER